MADHVVDISGLRIAYATAGAGAPLVLLHGGLSDGREWRPQFDTLSDEFAVYAWDAPGCGASDDPPQGWRMPDYADAVADWLTAIGVRRPHLLGLSWGSTLALEIYRRHPELPASLVLAGAYAGWAGSLTPDETQRRLSAFLDELQRPPEQWVSTYIPTMVTDAASPEVVDGLTALMCDTRPAGAEPMLRAMAAADLRDVLPTIRIPTLLVYGEHDVRSPKGVAEEMHRSIPGSRLVVIPNAGHCCNTESPEKFNNTVREFVRSLT